MESYEQAMARAGFTELPAVARADAPAPQPADPTYGQILDEIDVRLRAGRWEDDNPPGTPA